MTSSKSDAGVPLRFRVASILTCFVLVNFVRAGTTPQTPTAATSTGHKPAVSIIFVVDSTLLGKSESASVRNTAETFLRSLRDDDEYAIYICGEQPVLAQDFTDDPALLAAALHPVGANRGNALYDSVIAAVQFAGSDASNDQKVLLILSSGVDKGSKFHLDDAIAAAKKEGIGTVVIGFPQGGWRANHTLQRLASETAGTSYFPASSSEFDEVAATVAGHLIGPPVVRGKPLAPYGEIIVRSVPVAELPRTQEFRSGDNKRLEKLLVEKLRESKLFSRVVDATNELAGYVDQTQTATEVKKLEVAGVIVQYRRGSHLKRGTGGFLGSGVSRMKVRFVFRDVASHKAVLALTEEGAGSGGLLGGGNDQNELQAMARVVNRLLEDIKHQR